MPMLRPPVHRSTWDKWIAAIKASRTRLDLELIAWEVARFRLPPVHRERIHARMRARLAEISPRESSGGQAAGIEGGYQ